MSEFSGQIIGLEQTLAKAGRLLGVVTSQDAQAITMYVARRVQRAAQAAAPIGIAGGRTRDSKSGRFQSGTKVSENPGQLRRSIVTRSVRRDRVLADGPAAFVFPRIYRGAASVRAPHAHLVAFGTKDRTPRTGKVMAFSVGGRMVFTRRARGLRPNDYMGRAIATEGQAAMDELSEKFDDLLIKNLREGA